MSTEGGKPRATPGGDADLDRLWQQFKGRGSDAAREQLIIHYTALVKYVAGRVAVGLPQNVDQNDLVSYGLFGLIDAIDKFEPERGFKFETYAIARIKGNIVDELRAIDWVPRSVRSKSRQIETAYAKLEAKLHRSPTEEEVAAELDMTPSQLQAALSKISFVGVIALDDFIGGDSEAGATLGDMIASNIEAPGDLFERQELRDRLGAAIHRLPDRERTVLSLYYFESLTLARIGEVLGVSESRVCQIHTKAILQLRSKMTDQPV